jgi:ribosomal protein S18 acetylase RimI-like enzyme
MEGEAAGTIALRRNGPRSCEAKRLYARPQYRGQGVATELLRRLIAMARAEGYAEMFGDTLPSMANALALYRALGFRETGAYNRNPTPGAIYLRLDLICDNRT